MSENELRAALQTIVARLAPNRKGQFPRITTQFFLDVLDLERAVVATETPTAPTSSVSNWRAQRMAELSEPSRLTFEQFSSINRLRCESPAGFNHRLDSWSTSDWFLALLGELGEAANIAKKLNRIRDGIPGNKVSKEELQIKLRQELGDSFVYLDLLCQSVGVPVCDAAVEVFNVKSQELNCPIQFAVALSETPAPLSVSAPRNQSYLDDLRHDLQNPEFAFAYLSACAMDSGETLRVGIKDVFAALKSASPQPAPTVSREALMGIVGPCKNCGFDEFVHQVPCSPMRESVLEEAAEFVEYTQSTNRSVRWIVKKIAEGIRALKLSPPAPSGKE